MIKYWDNRHKKLQKYTTDNELDLEGSSGTAGKI